MTYARVPNGTGSFLEQTPTFADNNEGALSTNAVEFDNLFKTYPNPAKDFVYIAGDLDIVNSIKIFDATGKIVYQSFDLSKQRISIANLSNGLYTVAFSTDEGVGLKKLIINK